MVKIINEIGKIAHFRTYTYALIIRTLHKQTHNRCTIINIFVLLNNLFLSSYYSKKSCCWLVMMMLFIGMAIVVVCRNEKKKNYIHTWPKGINLFFLSYCWVIFMFLLFFSASGCGNSLRNFYFFNKNKIFLLQRRKIFHFLEFLHLIWSLHKLLFFLLQNFHTKFSTLCFWFFFYFYIFSCIFFSFVRPSKKNFVLFDTHSNFLCFFQH